jgi:hypothetical protein
MGAGERGVETSRCSRNDLTSGGVATLLHDELSFQSYDGSVRPAPGTRSRDQISSTRNVPMGRKSKPFARSILSVDANLRETEICESFRI